MFMEALEEHENRMFSPDMLVFEMMMNKQTIHQGSTILAEMLCWGTESHNDHMTTDCNQTVHHS